MSKSVRIDLPGDSFIEIVGGAKGGVVLRSDGIKAPCTYCGQEACERDCDESKAGGFGSGPAQEASEEIEEARLLHNAAVDGLEATLLALFSAGVDLSGAEAKEAIVHAVNAIAFHYPPA